MSWMYHYHYWIVVLLMMSGLYVVIASGNLLKKIVGLSIFQSALFLLFIAIGNVQDGSIPIFKEGETLYSNPLPHALILTAIVVALATTAVGLALVLRIHSAFGSIEEEDVQEQEHGPQGN